MEEVAVLSKNNILGSLCQALFQPDQTMDLTRSYDPYHSRFNRIGQQILVVWHDDQRVFIDHGYHPP
jgi:hypothetical protein